MRIVSLVPSLSEMVYDFGLQSELVGITKFCVRPPGLHRSAAFVGGTKDPDLDAIEALKPTHILVNEEENKPEHIKACKMMAPTYVSFPKDPREVPALLRESARFLDVSARGERFAREVEVELGELARSVEKARADGHLTARRYLYYIWREPYMVAADDTYISAMLALVGYENAAPRGTRYPVLTVDEARALAADLVLLSSEPYPFRKRDVERLKSEWPDAPEILKADGQLVSWYGTLTLTALRQLRRYVEGQAVEILHGF